MTLYQETASTPAGVRNLPGPGGLPLIGNLHQIRFSRLHLHLEKWADRFGPIYRVRIGPSDVVVVSDRATIQRLLVQRPQAFRRTRALEAVATEMRLKGVFAAEGDDWRRQRRIVAAALNRAHLEDFFPRLVMTAERLRRRWQQAAVRGETIDLCSDLMRFTVDVTIGLAFGIDANTLETPGPVIQRHLDKVFPVLHRRVNAPFPYWRYVPMPSDRTLARALDRLEEEVSAMVRTARERMAEKPEPTNFIEAILAALEDEGSGFTDADIFANAGTLLLAGEDTTANSTGWAVHYFMQYPEHFDRARQEVDSVIAPAEAIETLEQTKQLPFIDAFNNEAMRLKPVAPLHVLEPVSDVELMGCHVPRGTPIMMLVRREATREEHFADARRFDPERWLSMDKPSPHDPRAFLPFGAGPRLCPGRNIALTQIRTVLAMLVRNFDIHPAGDGVEERLAFTMFPANLRVQLVPRHKGNGETRSNA